MTYGAIEVSKVKGDGAFLTKTTMQTGTGMREQVVCSRAREVEVDKKVSEVNKWKQNQKNLFSASLTGAKNGPVWVQ